MKFSKIFVVFLLTIALITFWGCGKKKEEGIKIETKTVPAMKFAYLEVMGPYEQVGSNFMKIGEMAGRLKLKGKLLGIYLDDPSQVKPESCRSQVGLELLAGETPDTSYKIMDLPEQTVVFSLMKGPYEKIVKDYSKIFAWADSNGYKSAGPLMEIYLKNMGETTNPEEYLTEVRIPVTK
jgi:AraC family transcriptional regulator